jgi:hypothetical protein
MVGIMTVIKLTAVVVMAVVGLMASIRLMASVGLAALIASSYSTLCLPIFFMAFQNLI